MTGIAELNRGANLRRVAPAQPFQSNARIVIPIRPHLTANETLLKRLRTFVARHTVYSLRLSLATVFVWFGVLKLADVSPVIPLLRASIPFLANAPCLQMLGIVEITIGFAMLFERLAKQATVFMLLHLLGTFSLFLIAPHVIFSPGFPVLTMDGEFVLKNVVLITSALVILNSRGRDRVSYFAGRSSQVKTKTTRQSAIITSAQKNEIKSL